MFIGRAALRTGTWTPVLTFVTPGDLAVTYTTQWGEWVLDAGIVRLKFQIQTNTFTWTTSSGNARITGIPFTAKTVSSATWAGFLSNFQGITKANFTQFCLNIASGGTVITLQASGSAQIAGGVAAADLPSGSTKLLTGFIEYQVA